MNVQATSREEYFALAGEREPTLRAVDEIIQAAAPNLEPVLAGGMTGMGLGYGMVPYQTKSMKEPSECPLIGLANQKHHISLYICAIDKDGEYIAEKNADRLGKVSCGKSCIRFKKLEDLNVDVLKEIISDISTRIKSGEKLFGL